MKKLILIGLVAFVSLSGCKKAVEKLKEDAIMKAMTDGQWIITNFVQNGTDITSSFSSYKFQYYSNRTVDAIKNGTVEKNGSWGGDAATMTTWANFAGAPSPLSLINGTWHIDNNSWDFVVATQSTTTETRTMRLEKF